MSINVDEIETEILNPSLAERACLVEKLIEKRDASLC